MTASRHDLLNEAGYLIRRCHQINQSLFADEATGPDLTPVQTVALRFVCENAGIDQRRLAAQIGIDEATLGGVVRRLVARGFLERDEHAADRRVKRLKATPAGIGAWHASVPGLERLRDRLLESLDAGERATLVELLGRVIEHHEHAVLRRTVREPSQPGDVFDGPPDLSVRNIDTP